MPSQSVPDVTIWIHSLFQIVALQGKLFFVAVVLVVLFMLYGCYCRNSFHS